MARNNNKKGGLKKGTKESKSEKHCRKKSNGKEETTSYTRASVSNELGSKDCKNGLEEFG